MSLIQYGGSIGLTTDFQKVPSNTIFAPVPIIAVGSAQFSSFDIEINISSESITNGTSVIGYKLLAKYFSGGITNTTGHFGAISVGYTDPPVAGFETVHPSAQQVFELVFTYGTYDTVAHTIASDGGFEVFINNVSQFSITGIPLAPRIGSGAAWGFVEFGPAGWANSYYVSQSTTRLAGYSTQSFSTPGTIQMDQITLLMTPPFTYPDPENFTFPSDPNILEANNFSTVNSATFFVSGGGHWQIGHGGTGGNPALNTTGANFSNGAQTWTVAAQMLTAVASGYIFNVTATPFTPHTIVPPPTPPPGPGNILVTKTTIPSITSDSFDFTATSLSPTTFTLISGGQQLFSGVTAGSGYQVSEVANPNWTVGYTTSNGSPHTNLVVSSNTTTIVYVTNTHILTGSIYKIVPNKRNDTIFDEGDVKIPDPSFKTGLIGG